MSIGFRRRLLWLGAPMLLAVTFLSPLTAAAAEFRSRLVSIRPPSWSGSGTETSSPMPATHTEPAIWVAPPRPHVAGSTYTAESSNWSGQYESGSTYSSVGGDWVVPTVEPPKPSKLPARGSGSTAAPSLRARFSRPGQVRRPKTAARITTPGTSCTRTRLTRSGGSHRGIRLKRRSPRRRGRRGRCPSPMSRSPAMISRCHSPIRDRATRPSGSRRCQGSAVRRSRTWPTSAPSNSPA